MEDAGRDDEGAGDPARAFEDLRAEVAVMRRAVEALPGAWEENRPPDYSPDLGRIAKGLAVVAGQLDAINKHPALRMTPEQHQAAVAQAGSGLMREALQKLDRATQEAERERHQLAGLIGTVRKKRDQMLWLIALPVVVFLLTLLASPVVLGWLPFGLPSQAAALVVGDDRWNAGWDLMQAVNQTAEQQAAFGFNLVKANQQEIMACAEAAVKTKRDQRCMITVSAQ